MTLLIDPPSWPGHGRLWSHLTSDLSFDELHAFAASLDIPPRAFEGDHYDVPAEHYGRLVAAGAVPVASRELLFRLRAAGLRRPKRVGERVVASRVLPGGRGRIDTLASTRTPLRPAAGALLLVRAADGERVLAGPAGMPPAVGIRTGESLAAALRRLVGDTLVGVTGTHAATQIGYLRHLRPAPRADDVRAERLDRVDLVLHWDLSRATGGGAVGGGACSAHLPRPPHRWMPAEVLATAQPALAPLLRAGAGR